MSGRNFKSVRTQLTQLGKRLVPTALIVDDESNFADSLMRVVRAAGYAVDVVDTVASARVLIDRHVPEILFLDLTLPDGNGIELLDTLAGGGVTKVIIVTAWPSVDSAVDAIKGRVYDYFSKPLKVKQVRDCLKRIRLEDLQRASELESPNDTHLSDTESELPAAHFHGLVGCSAPMEALYTQIKRVAASNATVLISGETGSGKEQVARAVHAQSERTGEFVAVNCASIDERDLRKALFGAKLGGGPDQACYYHQAQDGTLMLDDVSVMSAGQQKQLVDGLESTAHGFALETPNHPVRLIAICGEDPTAALAQGRIREDLYYRLNVFPISVPPLRGRHDDIERLAYYLLRLLNYQHGKTKFLTDAVIRMFQQYSWPGNVRELKHIMQAAYIRSESVIDVDSVWGGVGKAVRVRGSGIVKIEIGSTLREAEQRLIVEALAKNDGDKRITANQLGISLKTLYNKLDQYNDSLANGPVLGDIVKH